MSDTFQFFTACTTCNARLRVRDAGAVGHIFPCPKCGGMVMIEAPPDPDDAEAETVPAEVAAGGVGLFVRPWLVTGLGSLGVVLVSGIAAYMVLGSRGEQTTRTTAYKPIVSVTEEASAEKAPKNSSAATYGKGERKNDNNLNRVAHEPASLPSIDLPDASTQPALSPSSPTQNALHHPASLAVEDPPTEPTVEASADPLLPPEFRADDTPPTGESRVASLVDLAALLEGPTAVDDDPKTERRTESSSSTAQDSTTRVNTTLANTATSTDSFHAIDIPSRFQVKLTSISVQDLPLLDFLRLVMELTDVPVQIDSRAFRQTGLDAASPVTVSAEDIDAGELLNMGLRELGLTYVVEATVVRITSPSLESSPLEERKFFCGDLLRTSRNGFDLARLIRVFILPLTWDSAGGDGSIEIIDDQMVVKQTREVHVETVLLLEKLRMARGLRRRLRTPLQYTQLVSKWQRLDSKLSRPISVNAWQPERFVDVVRKVEAAADLRLLVDWRSLTKAGWTRDAESTLVVRDVPVEAALHQLLDSAGLMIRPIDGQTIEITTAQVAATQPDLELYQLSPLGSGGPARLKQLAGAEQLQFAIDDASDRAVVLAPSTIHHQLIAR